MATISSAGVGSGLDINGLLSQLMAAERQPLVALQKKQSVYNTQISAYGKLRSALATFESTMKSLSSLSSFKQFTATSSDETVLTATAASTASLASSSIVVTALAQNHKLASSTYASSSTVVGTGTLTITVGTSAFSVTIGSTNNTLSQIADAINDSASNTGVTATVLNVTGGSKLVLTADSSGTSNALTVAVTGDGDGNDSDAAGLSNLIWSSAGTQNLSQVTAAQNAAFTVDGFAATSSSNTVTDVITGITLNLKKTGSATLNVTRNTSGVTDSINSFVKAYNDLRSTVESLRNGDLKGDLTLLSFNSGLQGVLNTPASGLTGSFTYLSEVGVSIQKDGTMKLDTTVLDNAFAADFKGVADVFADADQGFASRLDSLANNYLGINGLIDARTTGLNSRVKDLDTSIANMQRYLDNLEKNYRTQFAALDSLLGQLRSTSTYLSQQFSSLQSK